jgi:hypothetical protein
MPRQTVESYIAYPAIIPYPLLSFLGTAFKWFIILTCLASVPYSLYRCARIIEQVVQNPKPVHTAPQHRRHTPSTPKGQRP